MKCMYCREESPKATFSGREHVVPQSFGTFDEGNFTLHDKVCDSCNSYFANNLDLVMARDSYEGISRLPHGIIDPSEYKHLGKRSTVVFQQRGGAFENAYCYQEYDESLRKVGSSPTSSDRLQDQGSGEVGILPRWEVSRPGRLSRGKVRPFFAQCLPRVGHGQRGSDASSFETRPNIQSLGHCARSGRGP